MKYTVRLFVALRDKKGYLEGIFEKEVKLTFVPYNGLVYSDSEVEGLTIISVEWREDEKEFQVALDHPYPELVNSKRMEKGGWRFFES